MMLLEVSVTIAPPSSVAVINILVFLLLNVIGRQHAMKDASMAGLLNKKYGGRPVKNFAIITRLSTSANVRKAFLKFSLL